LGHYDVRKEFNSVGDRCGFLRCPTNERKKKFPVVFGAGGRVRRGGERERKLRGEGQGREGEGEGERKKKVGRREGRAEGRRKERRKLMEREEEGRGPREEEGAVR
jgi:hypothetical protein